MTYADWYDLAENHLSEKGVIDRDIAIMAYWLKAEYEVSVLAGRATETIRDLMRELFEEDSYEARAWFAQLSQDIKRVG